MFNKLRQWLVRALTVPSQETASNTHAVEDAHYRSSTSIVPYDENLLERSRTQWQFGDWESLTKLEGDKLQHHPDRAMLALLAAAGHLQQSNSQAARQLTRRAQEWGCSKILISQILISGVHNSLGRAAIISGEHPRALQHFQASILTGTPGCEAKLLSAARINEQLQQLGLQAMHLTSLGDNASAAPAFLDRRSE